MPPKSLHAHIRRPSNLHQKILIMLVDKRPYLSQGHISPIGGGTRLGV